MISKVDCYFTELTEFSFIGRSMRTQSMQGVELNQKSHGR